MQAAAKGLEWELGLTEISVNVAVVDIAALGQRRGYDGEHPGRLARLELPSRSLAPNGRAASGNRGQ